MDLSVPMKKFSVNGLHLETRLREYRVESGIQDAMSRAVIALHGLFSQPRSPRFAGSGASHCRSG
jgi:hypothetical protein